MPDLRISSKGSFREVFQYTFLPCGALRLNTDGAVADALNTGSVNGVPFIEFDPAAGAALAANDGFGFAFLVPYNYSADSGGVLTIRTFVGISGGGGTETGTFQLLIENNENDAATADPNDFTFAESQGAIAFDADNTIHELSWTLQQPQLEPGKLLGGEISLSAVTNMAVNTEELRLFGGVELIWRGVGMIE